MATRDGVDVGILGVLRGGMRPTSQHEVFAWTLIGTALGSLAVDAGWPDDEVLATCKAILDETFDHMAVVERHAGLACKLLALAVGDLRPRDHVVFLALCGATLQQIRAAAGNPEARQKLRELSDAAMKPRTTTEGD